MKSKCYLFVDNINASSPTAHPVRKDTIPTLKMRLELESERERELKQTVANLSKEIQQLRGKISTANATRRVYKETAAAKLALKLGEMEAEMHDESAKARNVIPHMRKRLKQNDISKKQNAIESKSVKQLNKNSPVTDLSDASKPELHNGPTIVSRMPDLEGEASRNAENASSFGDGFKIPEGMNNTFLKAYSNINFHSDYNIVRS